MTHQRPALDLLNDIGRGKLARELTEALHQLNTACLETGKKGQLQLRLTVEPGDLDNGTFVRVGKGRAGRTLDGRTWDEYPQEVSRV